MAIGTLPEEGELRLGPVSLPAGKRIRADNDPVAWVTVEEVPDAGRIWAALSDAGQQAGLVPILLGGLAIDPARQCEDEDIASVDVSKLDPMEAATLGVGELLRPWDTGEFDSPADVGQLDRMDAASLLKDLWDGKTHEAGIAEQDEDDDFNEYIKAELAPFSRQFPGLASAEDHQLTGQQLDDVLGSLPAARVGLVPATRPAAVLPLLGWDGTANHFRDALPMAAMLRSWENRFGARLLQVGFAWIRLLAGRPPRSVEHAQRIAAEHRAFCDECAGRGLTGVSEIATSLMQSPIWTFWWD